MSDRQDAQKDRARSLLPSEEEPAPQDRPAPEALLDLIGDLGADIDAVLLDEGLLVRIIIPYEDVGDLRTPAKAPEPPDAEAA